MDIQNPEMSAVDELLYTNEMFEQACFSKLKEEAKTIPEGFVLVPKEATVSFKEKLHELLFSLWTGDHGCDWDGFVSVDAIDPDEIWQMVIEAQEQVG